MGYFAYEEKAERKKKKLPPRLEWCSRATYAGDKKNESHIDYKPEYKWFQLENSQLYNIGRHQKK